MSIKLVFLGKLADLAGVSEREVDAPLDWGSLTEELDGALGDAVACGKIKVAVNGTVIPENSALAASDGDEVALLPPVSGG
ncbi:MAG: MoaD/ThiS family protein [Croceibacterium sp.]